MSDLEKWRSIGFVTRRTRWINEADRRLARDRDAYKRLRQEGLQPAQISGSARLERDASDPFEIERGRTYSKAEMPHVREGLEISEELGFRGPR